MNPNTKTTLIIGGIALAFLIGVPLIWGGLSGWQAGGWGMMGPGMMGGWMGFGAMFMVLFWGLAIWAVVALVQGVSRPGDAEYRQQDSALDVLKRRYARGEMSREEYEEKKRDLA